MEQRSEAQRGERDPVCRDCRHHWVTHDARHPWGCRAFGIVSSRPPSVEVRAASGRACTAFEAKPAAGKR